MVLIGKRDKVEVERIVKNLEKNRLKLESEIEEISESLFESQQQKKWVDWVKEFGSRIDKLKDPEFTKEDKKNFLKGIVNKIVVTNKDTRKHELKIEFRLPYVCDKFSYNNPSNKSKGHDKERKEDEENGGRFVKKNSMNRMNNSNYITKFIPLR